jgi:heme-degrading monooxygenase HmoA
MILRMWRAQSTVEKANEYVQHATRRVFPGLGAIEGHRGAYLLRRTHGQTVEFVVLTLWESMEAIRTFAGAALDRAVVEPEARAALSSFDDSVTHFEIVAGPALSPNTWCANL